MGFSNPASPGTIQPFYRFRDEFFWPAISGEQFPPAMSGLGPPTYTAYNGRPCYSTSNAGGGLITFPYIPRISAISGNQTLIMSWLLGCNGGAPVSNNWAMNFGSFRPAISVGPALTLSTLDQAGITRNVATGIAAPNQLSDGWMEIAVTILPDGTVTMAINGTLRATETHVIWPATLVGNNMSTPTWTINLQNNFPIITQVRARWE